jgi:hypothetical protein
LERGKSSSLETPLWPPPPIFLKGKLTSTPTLTAEPRKVQVRQNVAAVMPTTVRKMREKKKKKRIIVHFFLSSFLTACGKSDSPFSSIEEDVR